jgi:hypothetical protein
MNQFRCKQLKSTVVLGFKILAIGFFNRDCEKSRLLSARNSCSIPDIKSASPPPPTPPTVCLLQGFPLALTDVIAKVVIYEALVEGKLEAPKHLARTVKR